MALEERLREMVANWRYAASRERFDRTFVSASDMMARCALVLEKALDDEAKRAAHRARVALLSNGDLHARPFVTIEDSGPKDADT